MSAQSHSSVMGIFHKSCGTLLKVWSKVPMAMAFIFMPLISPPVLMGAPFCNICDAMAGEPPNWDTLFVWSEACVKLGEKGKG